MQLTPRTNCTRMLATWHLGERGRVAEIALACSGTLSSTLCSLSPLPPRALCLVCRPLGSACIGSHSTFPWRARETSSSLVCLSYYGNGDGDMEYFGDARRAFFFSPFPWPVGGRRDATDRDTGSRKRQMDIGDHSAILSLFLSSSLDPSSAAIKGKIKLIISRKFRGRHVSGRHAPPSQPS